MGYNFYDHDRYAVESQGAISDRTIENLGASDRAIIAMRKQLLGLCAMNWGAISPAIFGAMFQTVIELEATDRRRELGAHEEIQAEFHHDSENRWCLDCHDGANREMLHLINGTLVPFTESYRLCGQCHGDKYRDWRRGVHGKRTGEWNGERTYLLCVHCHNPHNPRFQPLRPMPPPQRPSEVRR